MAGRGHNLYFNTYIWWLLNELADKDGVSVSAMIKKYTLDREWEVKDD